MSPMQLVDYHRDFGYTIIRLLLRGERMDYMAELAAIANKNGGIIEVKDVTMGLWSFV